MDLSNLSNQLALCAFDRDSAPSACAGPLSERATVSKTRSISGTPLVKFLRQKAYRGFLSSSMKVMSRPH